MQQHKRARARASERGWDEKIPGLLKVEAVNLIYFLLLTHENEKVNIFERDDFDQDDGQKRKEIDRKYFHEQLSRTHDRIISVSLNTFVSSFSSLQSIYSIVRVILPLNNDDDCMIFLLFLKLSEKRKWSQQIACWMIFYHSEMKKKKNKANHVGD